MKVSINTRYCTEEPGAWLPLEKTPHKVLLETDDGEGNPSGNPAIRMGDVVFYFGQPHDKVKLYRVLALKTVVVCIQE